MGQMDLKTNFIKKRHKRDPSFDKHQTFPFRNDIPIDIVIPVIERDLEVLEHGIVAAKNLIGHKINKIFLVAPPNSEKISAFAQKHNCVLFDENEVIPHPDVKLYGGWYMQQFIKLNADTIVEQPHYLVFDADTVFLRPNVFVDDDHPDGDHYILNIHSTCHCPRKVLASKWFGNTHAYKYDFVPHHMFFSTKVLGQMKKHLENRYHKPWFKVFLDDFKKDKDTLKAFSEFELYATYLTEFTDEKIHFVSSANIGVLRNRISAIDSLKAAYANDYKSLSFHYSEITKEW